MPPHVAEFSLITPQYGQKASCLHLPPMVNDCLMRHPCRWKFDNRNSLSVPTQHSRGTMAVNWGAPVLAKEDRAAGRYLSKPSQVYRGIQSAIAVNWSGELNKEAFLPEDRQPIIGYYLR